jgi:hypothetical protein
MIRKFLATVCVAHTLALASLPALAASNIEMVTPAALIGSTIFGQSGAQYTPDAAGYFSAQQVDVIGFLADGYTLPPSGLSPAPQKLIDGKNAAGTTLASSAPSGEFGISLTPATSEYLTGEAAESNTKTDHVVFEYVAPANYHAGQNLTVTVTGLYAGTGTAGTVTLAAAAYLNAAAGTQGSTLIATAAQNLTTSSAAYAFVITGTTLVAGSRLTVELTTVIQETGGSNSLNAELTNVTIG